MPQSTEWLYSPSRNRLFAICSYVTAAIVTLDVCAIVVGLFTSPHSVSIENPSWLIRIAVGVLFLGAAACILSQFTLWFGMMVWTALWWDEWLVLRVLLLLFQLITLGAGSALVYAVFYRKIHNSRQARMALRAGASA